MRRFFDELNEVKLQQGELPDPRGKKKSPGIDIALQEPAPGALAIDTIPAGGLDPAGMVHGQQGELMGSLGVSSTMLPAGFEAEVATHKKGGVFGAADAAEVAYGEDHGVHPGVRAEEQRERGRDPVDAADAAREGQWQPGGRRRAGEAV